MFSKYSKYSKYFIFSILLILTLLAINTRGYASFEIPSRYPTDRSFDTPTAQTAQQNALQAKQAYEQAQAKVDELKKTNPSSNLSDLKKAEKTAENLKQEYLKAQELADSLNQNPNQ